MCGSRPSRESLGRKAASGRDKLSSVSFDPGRVEVKGSPVPLLNDAADGVITGKGQFDFSAAPVARGTFVYVTGKTGASRAGRLADRLAEQQRQNRATAGHSGQLHQHSPFP
jgi:hypothetical protein